MRALAALALIVLAACAQTPPPATATDMADRLHPEGAIFDPALAAMPAVDNALARASQRGSKVLVMLGGNWCHDSRALAAHFQEERFASLIADEFELVVVNIGLPQTGDGFNLDVASRFGVAVEGTPTLLLLSADGHLLNTPEDAVSWRNSASRDADDIHATLQGWAAS